MIRSVPYHSSPNELVPEDHNTQHRAARIGDSYVVGKVSPAWQIWATVAHLCVPMLSCTACSPIRSAHMVHFLAAVAICYTV